MDVRARRGAPHPRRPRLRGARRATPRARPSAVPSWRVDVSHRGGPRRGDRPDEGLRRHPGDAARGSPCDTPAEPRRGAGGRAHPRRARGGRVQRGGELQLRRGARARALRPARSSTGDGSGRALGIALKNPISADLAVMRTSLVPSLLKNAAHNRRQRVEDVRLYEIARVYHPHPDAEATRPRRSRVRGRGRARRPPQPGRLGGRAATPRTSTTRRRRSPAVLEALGVEARWRARGDALAPPAHLGDGPRRGRRGRARRGRRAPPARRGGLRPAARRPRLRLSLDALLARGAARPAAPAHPAASRRCCATSRSSWTTPSTAASVEALVREEPLVEAVTLFDVYRGAPLPAGKKNLALRHRATARRTGRSPTPRPTRPTPAS